MAYAVTAKEKGLFVIIKQVNHKLYYPTNSVSDNWTGSELNYDADETELLKTLKLNGKPCLLAKSDLTNASSGNDSFDGFIDQVCAYKDVVQMPEFIMFFLMSHGFENGDFLLSSHGDSAGNPEVPCCNQTNHTKADRCFARNIFTSVIQKMCDTTAYPEKAYPKEIPKIFVIQCCRGREARNIEGKSQALLSDHPSAFELFMPSYENVLIFRASVEGYISWVEPDDPEKIITGSLLIQYLCETIEELQNSDKDFQLLVDRVQANSQATARHILSDLEARRESISGGWILNVCQRTTAKVTNYIYLEVILPHTTLGLLLKRLKSYYDIVLQNTDASNALRDEFLTALEKYKNEHTQRPTEVGNVISAFSDSRIYWTSLLYYLWCKINNYTNSSLYAPGMEDSDRFALQTTLDVIARELANLDPLAPLGQLLMLENVSTDIHSADGNTRTNLLLTFLDSLKKAKSGSHSVKMNAAVSRVLHDCEDSGRINGLAILQYLWQNVRRLSSSKHKLDFSAMNLDDGREPKELNDDLDTIVLVMTEHKEPYSKQQPHISSSLCKRLSCINMVKEMN